MGISKFVKRFLKKEFGPRKKQLPKSLDFLSSINFHAIVEDDSSGRTVRTIEVKPTTLKRLIAHMEFLEDYLHESSELVKSLKSNIRKLRADNKDFIENQNRSDVISLELDAAQEKIKVLTAKISTIDQLSSEKEILQGELDRLKIDEAKHKKEIERLAFERTRLIELEVENKKLHEKIEQLESVNRQLMENIASTKERGGRRNKNAFFGSDAKEKIINTKPYRG